MKRSVHLLVETIIQCCMAASYSLATSFIPLLCLPPCLVVQAAKQGPVAPASKPEEKEEAPKFEPFKGKARSLKD